MKLYRSLMAGLAFVATLCASAAPAMPGFRSYLQPDGTSITLELKGDEYGHFYLTEDGQMVLPDGNGYFFATADAQGNPIASTVLASNPSSRTPLQTAFLATVNADNMKSAVARTQLATRTEMTPANIDASLKKAHVGLFPNNNVQHSGSPKFLVILVEYQDIRFDNSVYSTNAHDYFYNLLNQSSFSEYNATGSARDYFRQASNGAFTPQFDVYGPVTLDYNRAYYGTNTATRSDSKNSYRMVTHACQKLDGYVDFSQYDTDGDGYVDNVFVFFAGQGENSGGPAESVWSHSWYVKNGAGVNLRLDGKYIDRYACTNEMNYSTPEGVGTFLHEFSHVLGLPDLYVTDYGAAANLTPGNYDLMDVGSYNNNSRTPPTYSIYERNAMGWIEPTVLTAGQNRIVSLNSILSSNQGCIINNPNNSNEFFLIENRQKTGWDAHIPNSGMLIWHIDYVSSVWKDNKPNNSASHQYVDILEAYGIADNKSDETMRTYTFPGSRRVTFFDNFVTWNGQKLDYPLTDINEMNGVINFEVCHHNTTTGPIGGDDFVLVTDASQLANKNEVIIATEYNGRWYAMTSNSNRAVQVTVSGNKISTSNVGEACVYTLQNNGGSYPWAFKDNNTGKYFGNDIDQEGLFFSPAIFYGYSANYNPSLGKNAFIFSNACDHPFFYFYGPSSVYCITNNKASDGNYYCPRIFMRQSAEANLVLPPTPSSTGGTFSNPVQLSFTRADSRDVIKYQMIGYSYTEGTYSSPITIDRNMYIRAWSERDGNTSDYVIVQFMFKTNTPTITPSTGSFTNCPKVTLSCSTADSRIYYTTTPEIPFQANTWTAYNGPFVPEGDSPLTLRAIAVRDDWSNSDIVTATYTFESDIVVPDEEIIFKLVTDASTLKDGQRVIIAAPTSDGWKSIRSWMSSGTALDVVENGTKIENYSDRVAVLTLVATGNDEYPWSFKDPKNSDKFIGTQGILTLQYSTSNSTTGFAARYNPASSTATLTFQHTSNNVLYYIEGYSEFRFYPESTGTMYITPQLFAEVGVPNSSVDQVIDDNEDAEVEYYNLQGIRVVNPDRGFYIRRQGNKVQRIFVR